MIRRCSQSQVSPGEGFKERKCEIVKTCLQEGDAQPDEETLGFVVGHFV